MHDLEYGAATDRGALRSINEDSVLAQAPVFVVADGVGGSEAGEVASAIVVEEFSRLAERPTIDPDDVGITLALAHGRVQALHQGRPYGPGTTAVGAVGIADSAGGYWVIFNIGDSRIYQRTGDPDAELVQISVDHSHVQELVEAGVITAEEARSHPERNLVTRAVGADDAFQPDYWVLPMVPGDRLLLCSDGLLADCTMADISELVSLPGQPADVAEELVALALRGGARDNVSAVVVDVLDGSGDHERFGSESRTIDRG